MPCIFGCIAATKVGTPVLQPCDGVLIQPEDVDPSVIEAREELHDDLVRRWATELPDERLWLYCVSLLCDTSLRKLELPGMTREVR